MLSSQLGYILDFIAGFWIIQSIIFRTYRHIEVESQDLWDGNPLTHKAQLDSFWDGWMGVMQLFIGLILHLVHFEINFKIGIVAISVFVILNIAIRIIINVKIEHYLINKYKETYNVVKKRAKGMLNIVNDNSTTRKELIQDNESIFQFSLTISLILVTIVDVLFNSINATSEQIGLVELKWANIPIALAVAYVIFRIFKNRFHEWVLRWSNYALLFEIILIVAAITVVLIDGNQIHGYLNYYTLKVSLWSAMTLSTLIPIFLIVSSILFRVKK